jgi:hypothetical protein
VSSAGDDVKYSNVVNLGQVRDILAVWDEVRDHLISGEVDRFQVTLGSPTGKETVYLGGVFKEDGMAAISAALKMSMIRMMEEDEPPKFVNSK